MTGQPRTHSASAHHFTVRLRCGHLATFTGSCPPYGDLVHCLPCAGRSRVEFWYFKVGASTAWCGAQAPWRDRNYGILQLRCTLDKGHDPADKHRDGPLDTWFADRPRLRSGTQGNCRRA